MYVHHFLIALPRPSPRSRPRPGQKNTPILSTKLKSLDLTQEDRPMPRPGQEMPKMGRCLGYKRRCIIVLFLYAHTQVNRYRQAYKKSTAISQIAIGGAIIVRSKCKLKNQRGLILNLANQILLRGICWLIIKYPLLK